MANIPTVRAIAADANYPAGTDAWSSTPTKVAPPGSLATTGYVPGVAVSAQHENYIKDEIYDHVRDLQGRAVIKQADSGGPLFTWMLGAYLPQINCFVAASDSGGTPKITKYAPNDLTKSAATATTIPAYNNRFAYDNVSKTLACFPSPLSGSSGNVSIIADVKALTYTTAAAPTLNARYQDACQDQVTGRAVLAAGLDSGTPVYGIAYGQPSALSWTAAPVGWASATRTWVASSPTETRVFSDAKTYSTADGGATLSSCVSTVWTAGLPAGSVMYRPTWDPTNNRWICSTHDTGSHALASASSRLWTSSDGITWTTLNAFTKYAFIDLLAHKGWLFGIAVELDLAADAGHAGLVVLYSTDGGSTWKHTGCILSMTPPADVATSLTPHEARLVACDDILLATTYRATGASDFEYVAIQTGSTY